MLKLKHSYHLDFPHITFGTPQPLELAPVPDEIDDELTQAILNDPTEHDNNWELNERPDVTELDSYWTQVEDDLQNDPEWIDFGHEETSID